LTNHQGKDKLIVWLSGHTAYPVSLIVKNLFKKYHGGFMKKITVFAVVLFAAASLWALDLKTSVSKDLTKDAGKAATTAASKTDADLEILTKKLKNVQNEKGPIIFKTGSAVLDNTKCETTLKTLADIMKAASGYNIQIDGHTDSVGNAQANMTLSQKRAESVKSYLVSKYAVDGTRLSAKGFGSTQPIADNKTKEGQAKNRRVDFTVTRK
jgi:outer membrane protein OmpA-like peptidoglycan-associated protein